MPLRPLAGHREHALHRAEQDGGFPHPVGEGRRAGIGRMGEQAGDRALPTRRPGEQLAEAQALRVGDEPIAAHPTTTTPIAELVANSDLSTRVRPQDVPTPRERVRRAATRATRRK